MDKRHKFLERLITVKEEEVTSYENMNACLITVTVCVCVFSILEVASYFTYLNYVSNVKILNIELTITSLVSPMDQDSQGDKAQ